MKYLVFITTMFATTYAVAQGMPSEEVHQNAEQVAATVIKAGWPDVDAAPVANCVRDNSAPADLVYLGGGDTSSVDDARKAVVLAVLMRPETLAFAKDNGVTLNLGKGP